MPGRSLLIPGTLPAKPVTKYQASRAPNAQFLDNRGELKLFGDLATCVAPCIPEVSPDQASPNSQFDGHKLVIAAGTERNRRPRQKDEYGSCLDLDAPLLGGEPLDR